MCLSLLPKHNLLLIVLHTSSIASLVIIVKRGGAGGGRRGVKCSVRGNITSTDNAMSGEWGILHENSCI